MHTRQACNYVAGMGTLSPCSFNGPGRATTQPPVHMKFRIHCLQFELHKLHIINTRMLSQISDVPCRCLSILNSQVLTLL